MYFATLEGSAMRLQGAVSNVGWDPNSERMYHMQTFLRWSKSRAVLDRCFRSHGLALRLSQQVARPSHAIPEFVAMLHSAQSNTDQRHSQ